jgi:exopolysaccharide biosynthesis polyprenyl glycosylphosphotransferase
MATATIETATPNVGTGFPSRLIPGSRASVGSYPRKKAQFATLDRRLWEWRPQEEFFRSAKRPHWASFLEAILPQPSTRSQRAWLVLSVLADFLAIVFSFAISGVAWQPSRPSASCSPLLPLSALSSLILYAAIFTLLGYSERLYHPETVRAPRQERFVLAKVIVWSTGLVVGTLLLSPVRAIPVVRLAASSPLSFLLMLAWRTQQRRTWEQAVRHGSYIRNVLIVGAGRVGQELASNLERDRPRRRIVRGFLDEKRPVGGNVHGRVRDLARVARRHFVDEIILTIPPTSDAAQEAIWQARRNRINVKVVPDVFGFDPAAVSLEKFDGVPVLTLWEERIPTLGLLVKRAIDAALSSAALVFLAPLLGAIALAIKLDSTGPVLYRATRLGRKGQRFECCKFRTMVADADRLKEKLRQCNEREGAFFKITNDPRVTHLGRILRRYSLDELPQLWNILRGEMSLVGPRPHPVDDFERYQLEDLQRLEITPGLTGLWQVTARRDPSFERSMSLDREYIAGWNLWIDFKILCKTMLVVLRGEGA